MHDILIIGAGTTGNYLAIKLSKKGYKVAVLDKKSSAGENICCTGIISKDCLDLLQLNDSIRKKEIDTFNFISPSNKNICLKIKRDMVYIVDRPELDRFLINTAVNLGAEYHYRMNVKDIKITDKLTQAIATDVLGRENIFESEMLVLTTGFESKLISKIGIDKIREYHIGVQTPATGKKEGNLEIYLDHDLAPGGFGWNVPLWEDKVLIGLICKNKPVFYLKKFLEKLIRQNKISNTQFKIDYGILPIRPLKKTYGNRFLIVGEAAGQIKPITGGGIYYGILCANIAIEAIENAIKSQDLSAQKLSKYQKDWHKLLINELFISHYVQKIWEKLNNHQINHLFDIASKLDLQKSLISSKNLYFDRHSKMILNLLISQIPFIKY